MLVELTLASLVALFAVALWQRRRGASSVSEQILLKQEVRRLRNEALLAMAQARAEARSHTPLGFSDADIDAATRTDLDTQEGEIVDGEIVLEDER
ncbi:MAG: hypothetical protein JHC84_05380 [Solirubrobacteraceae bacterium]|nr:hypothetical protein [Solirubrobacteraceae bacterium]